jgi:hypothetical protein
LVCGTELFFALSSRQETRYVSARFMQMLVRELPKKR